MRAFVKSVMDYAVASFFGAILTFAVLSNNPPSTSAGTLGGCDTSKAPELKAAETPKVVVSPRYTVNHHGPFTQVTDNETNRQYVYVNNPNQPSKLVGYVDLNQAGQPELKATKFENGKWQDK